MSNDPQQQMIRDAMKSIAERKPGRTKLVYDKTKRTIVAVAEGLQTPRALNITAEDADMFGVVTVSSRWLREEWDRITRSRMAATKFSVWDNGDAFTQCSLSAQTSSTLVEAIVSLEQKPTDKDAPALDVILTALQPGEQSSSSFLAPNGVSYRGTASARVGELQTATVIFADVQPELSTRRRGLLESTVLNDKAALCIGLGTGGAHSAIELAKCGVGRFMLVDRDRLTVGNVVRHPGGVSQVGRSKVNVIRDMIYEKNPDAKVEAYPSELTFDNCDTLRQLIARADVVMCGTDNRPSKLLVNQLCLEASKVAIYGGAFRRAYGGQVLRVRPKRSPCHQCFVAAMPDEASDVEVSSASDAEGIAYSDRPVAVEPGLSLDVLPIANMVAKLALLELLKDKPTTLSVLNRDFDAPWYLWLNRPEPGTPYASWPPLSESIDEMTIHRWYGIYIERDPACPVCGDFVGNLASAYRLDVASLGQLPSEPQKD